MSNFKLDEKRVWFLPEPSGDKQPPPEWICSHLSVLTITKDERGENFGRLLEIKDVDDCTHQWALPMKLLAGDAIALREILYSKGLLISGGKGSKVKLNEYIQTFTPSRRIQCVDKTGWFGDIFVLPEESIGDSGVEVVFQSDSLLPSIYEESGTLEEWKQYVAAPCIDNSRLVFCVSCAFAAPLLKILQIGSGGFHFFGPSSCGKTTLLRVAASVYGGDKFFKTWRATANALESISAQHSDSLLCLDES